MRPSARLALLLLPVGALLLAGCGQPPGLDDEPRGPAASGAASPGASPPAFPTVPGGPSGFPSQSPGAGIATACAGDPDEADVLDLLRDEEVLGAGTDAEVVQGPLCAGTWQYAVVNVPDLDPLQVVTQGGAGDLELVTAGTDVCTVEVRIQAPPGIRDVADCVS